MSASSPLFRFAQVELPWRLGPPDGRYLLRPAAGPEPARAAGPEPARAAGPEAAPTHVLVLATLGAPERRRLSAVRKRRPASPEPEPTPVATSRATVIWVSDPLVDPAAAGQWLERAGEPELEQGLAVLNRVLHAFRIVTADPYLHMVGRDQAIVARIGFGGGEQVADGLWTAAHELLRKDPRGRRARVLHPQARLAAVLGAHDHPLACEELALRARLDLDHGRDREAALQVLVALDAGLAELTSDPAAAGLGDRLTQLRGQREAIAGAAQSALAGSLAEAELEHVSFTLGRIESALRARAVHNA